VILISGICFLRSSLVTFTRAEVEVNNTIEQMTISTRIIFNPDV
jgi:hypothetical protein